METILQHPKTALKLFTLGSPEVKYQEENVHIPRRKALALLVYLVVTGIPHRRESLVAMLWPEDETSRAFAYLRQALWELKKALGDDCLLATRETVAANLDSAIWLDCVAFFQKLEILDTHAHLRPDLCSTCITSLTEAQALYRGDFLAGFGLPDAGGFDDWLYYEANTIRQRYAWVLEKLTSAYQAAGDFPQALEVAQEWLSMDPLNEAAYRRVMEVLASSGQRSAALQQFAACEQVLSAELGVEPAGETLDLVRRIQAGEFEKAAVQMPQVTLAVPTVRHNLPAQLTTFIGREREIAQIQGRLGDYRLVTLTGSGGVGKSRLALRVAQGLVDQYPNGVWLVKLAPISDPAQVPQAVASALDVRSEETHSVSDLLTDFLRAKKLLLVLDNCEHVIDACAYLVENLLVQCPELRLLASSREALGVAGETVVRVPSLTQPLPTETDLENLVNTEAVRLFVERARSALPGFVLTENNAPAVVQICRRLDGIPLALELAAHRVNALQVEQIADRLDDAFRLLTGGRRTALPRQQTLRAAIDWSYRLLSHEEQLVLERLAVFSGGWTLSAAEMVCSGNGLEKADVMDLLTRLVDKSLVEIQREPGKPARYALLETIRQYVREQLQAHGGGDEIRRQHACWYLELAEQAHPALYGPEVVEWLNRLEMEHDNLRAALSWALDQKEAELVLRLAGALGSYWEIRSYSTEGVNWLESALALDAETGEQASQTSRARAFLALGKLTFDFKQRIVSAEKALQAFRETADQQGLAEALSLYGVWLYFSRGEREIDASYAYMEEGLALSQQIGDKFLMGIATFMFYWPLINQGFKHKAYEYLEKSLALFRELGNQWGVSNALKLHGLYYWDQGDIPRAETFMREALAIFRSTGAWEGVVDELGMLVEVTAFQGRFDQARALGEEAVGVGRETGVPAIIALGLEALGHYAVCLSGDLALAQSYLEEAVKLDRAGGTAWHLCMSLCRLGNIYRRQGNFIGADQMLTESRKVIRNNYNMDGGPIPLFRTLLYQGDLARAQGDHPLAEQFYRESLQVWKKFGGGSLPLLPNRLDGLAKIAAIQGQLDRSARLFGASAGLRKKMGGVLPPVDQAECNEHLEIVKAGLSLDSFTVAWEAGERMTTEQVVTFALEPIE